MKQKDRYRGTILSCYVGSMTMAIVNNFVPLLFLTFQTTFGFSLGQIGLLVSFNFCTQLTVDALAARYADKIGYRRLLVAAQILLSGGLVLLSILPYAIGSAYVGVVLAVITYSIGCGLNEVLISPVVEACPSEHKAAAMSLLHSFYCWGSVLVVLVSTVLFLLFDVSSWRVISCLWALIPAVNAVCFTRVPIAQLVEEGKSLSLGKLLATPLFWLLALLMLTAGATELSMTQWASAFAESGLKVSKAMGDLMGPCMFALFMGVGRVIQFKLVEKIDLLRYLLICAMICTVSYLLAALAPSPVLSLLGFALCGFGVAAMWPGTLSLGAAALPFGGTAMFALLALCGDIGCAVGPALVGFVSGAAGDNLHIGILLGTVFPALAVAVLLLHSRTAKNKRRQSLPLSLLFYLRSFLICLRVVLAATPVIAPVQSPTSIRTAM